MQTTLQAGVRSVEIDLRESKDGVIFLCHDATLDRTTDAKGPVASHTATELSHVRLRDGEGRATEETLYRFEDVLSWAKKNGAQLLVDLKDTPPSDAAKEIRQHGMQQQAILLTFDQKTAQAALEADPNIQVSMLVKTLPEVDATILAAHGHPLALYVAQTADPAVYTYAREQKAFTLTDMLGRPEASVEAEGPLAFIIFSQSHPADLVVTNDALGLQSATRVPRGAGSVLER